MRFLFFMVTCTGFEPVYPALRTQCVRPLHQQAKKTKTIITKLFCVVNNYFLHLICEFYMCVLKLT